MSLTAWPTYLPQPWVLESVEDVSLSDFACEVSLVAIESEVPGGEAASARTPAPTPETWVTHPLDLDIGEVADGYRLIARSISLSAKHLLCEFAFSPNLPTERKSG